jgi:hypothetical protein
MKTKLIFTTLILVTVVTVARQITPFQGWDRLEKESTDIDIVNCGKPTPPYPTINGPASDFSTGVLAVLKGDTNVSSARLWSDYKLQQGENYLIFGYYDSGIYQAFETYRVIPLGKDFSTSLIVGKSLDDQIRILFKLRIDHLNQQMKEEQEEKQRLEEGLMK